MRFISKAFEVQANRTRGHFTLMSMGHDPIRSLYIRIGKWALEIAIAPRMG